MTKFIPKVTFSPRTSLMLKSRFRSLRFSATTGNFEQRMPGMDFVIGDAHSPEMNAKNFDNTAMLTAP